MYPAKFENLIAELHKLPGIGVKSAERMAFSILNWTEEDKNALITALKDIRSLEYCSECGNLTETSPCSICGNEQRNHNLICVVETPKDLFAIEQLGEFNGVYHVLGGTINVKKGIMPDDLNITQLLNRISDDTEEIILALDPTPEGELTSEYISRLINGKASVSRLAYGIPLGGKLDYTDQRTLTRALEGRTRLK